MDSRFTGKIDITEIEIAWVAGLLEGEGCWAINRNTPYKRWITTTMTDRDVLEKAQKYTGVGTIQLGEAPGQPHHKQCYRWMVIAKRDREWLTHLVYPHMGKRRQQKIQEFLQPAGIVSTATR